MFIKLEDELESISSLSPVVSSAFPTELEVEEAFFAVTVFQVTAMNHVSTLTEDFNVTVDRLQPMANLTVKGVPDVVPQGSTQTLTTSVLIDMSVPATVRYEHMGRDLMFDSSLLSTSVPDFCLFSVFLCAVMMLQQSRRVQPHICYHVV